MLKKGKRLTSKELRKEQKRFKKIAPVYEKSGISKFEEYVCNCFAALTETVKNVKIDKEKVEMLIWLHQFEFFERRWVWENYKASFLRQESYGSRRAKNVFNWLIKNEYVDFYAHEKITYETYEHRENFYRTEEIVSDAKYKLSVKGLAVVREYFKNLTGDTPSQLDKSKKRLLYKGQNPWDNLDYTNF